MTIRVLFLALAAAAALLLASTPGVLADDGEADEHDRARQLLEHGEIHSLRDVLDSIARRLDGDVVGVELMQINLRWVYRVQIVDRDGRRTFVDVDAGTDVKLDDDGEDD